MPVTVPRSTLGWRSPRFGVLVRNRIKECREACGVSVIELAAQLGVRRQHLDYVEHHQVRPTVDLLARAAFLLNVHPWSDIVVVTDLDGSRPIPIEEILRRA